MNDDAIDCIADTLRHLIDEAERADEQVETSKGSRSEGFEVGRAEALAEVLHTWANQLQTFGIDRRLDGSWDQLRNYLSRHGY